MKNVKERITVQPSLNISFDDTTVYKEDTSLLPIRILPLSLQTILNVILICMVAKGLVLLLKCITNLTFYHRSSFHPALVTIGGALGVLLGIGILRLFRGSKISIAYAVMIGMAFMFTGALTAILSSILFALETTGQIRRLLPLIGACTTAYLVSRLLTKGSIKTEKNQRRGVCIQYSYEPDIIQTINTGDHVKKVYALVSIKNNVGELSSWPSSNMNCCRYDFLIERIRKKTLWGM